MDAPDAITSHALQKNNANDHHKDENTTITRDAHDFSLSLDLVGFDSFQGDEARHRALAAARSLVRRLETPVETAWAISFDVPALYAALRAAHDNHVFERLDEDGHKPKSTAELAGTADPAVIFRVLRHLAAMDIVKQDGPDHWIGTRHSSSYQNPEVFAVAEYSSQVTFDSLRTLPKYWRSVGYWPRDSLHGSWQYFIGKPQLFYDWVGDHAEVQDCFTNLMKGYTSQRGSWVDVYPTDIIMSTAEKEGPLVVDMGAGSGHDLMKFLQRHPEAAGRLIFQDRENIVKAASEECQRDGLVPMTHDFFDPQPVKGARVYFLHSIFHNWPDREGREILRTLSEAMRNNYSTILINDMIVPSRNADRFQTGLDLCMASILNAKERSEEEWTEFLKSAGFKVLNFWRNPSMHDGVVEAVPLE